MKPEGLDRWSVRPLSWDNGLHVTGGSHVFSSVCQGDEEKRGRSRRRSCCLRGSGVSDFRKSEFRGFCRTALALLLLTGSAEQELLLGLDFAPECVDDGMADGQWSGGGRRGRAGAEVGQKGVDEFKRQAPCLGEEVVELTGVAFDPGGQVVMLLVFHDVTSASVIGKCCLFLGGDSAAVSPVGKGVVDSYGGVTAEGRVAEGGGTVVSKQG